MTVHSNQKKREDKVLVIEEGRNGKKITITMKLKDLLSAKQYLQFFFCFFKLVFIHPNILLNFWRYLFYVLFFFFNLKFFHVIFFFGKKSDTLEDDCFVN